MPWDTVFRVANLAAALAWSALILLPRRPWLRRLSVVLVVGSMCCTYTALVAVYLFPSGGGFFSLAGVQRLFMSPQVALAGWLHYLSFDLFIGWWIATRFDAAGVSRWLQAPLLLTTFMVGPVGLLVSGAALAALGGRADESPRALSVLLVR